MAITVRLRMKPTVTACPTCHCCLLFLIILFVLNLLADPCGPTKGRQLGTLARGKAQGYSHSILALGDRLAALAPSGAATFYFGHMYVKHCYKDVDLKRGRKAAADLVEAVNAIRRNGAG